ncbi:MAG: YbgC/FadM family acyl-CoA thioesterase [Alphaproteobacteria bacterium]|nr:YbgC/FadM family acyl-CoA thioesterase [Alphaproteobacteria bacterium]
MTGTVSAGIFVFPVRVYYEDTDAATIVYHSNYLKFAERARTELIRAFGDDHGALRRRFGIAFVVSKCDMHCLSPAHLDELIEVRTTLNGLGGASIDLQQDIWRGDTRLVRLRVLLACTNADSRAVRIPAEVRQRFVAWETGTSRN